MIVDDEHPFAIKIHAGVIYGAAPFFLRIATLKPVPEYDRAAAVTRRTAVLRRVALLLAASAGVTAWGAEREICEGMSGQQLIRCIEAEARGKPLPPSTKPVAGRSVELPRTTASPLAAPRVDDPPAAPAEDCTGRRDDELRRCLAAGGRLQPSAAVVGDAPRTAVHAYAVSPDTCDNKTGEELRRCVEAAAKTASNRPTAPAATRHETIQCTGYHPADQPLCVHRNAVIAECRNPVKYADFGVCLRSQMMSAPTPGRADCSKLQARSRTHCESRNAAYSACLADKLAYFSCLEHRLGADAVLRRK